MLISKVRCTTLSKVAKRELKGSRNALKILQVHFRGGSVQTMGMVWWPLSKGFPHFMGGI